jgi:hypothetical protein
MKSRLPTPGVPFAKDCVLRVEEGGDAQQESLLIECGEAFIGVDHSAVNGENECMGRYVCR